MFLKNVTRSLLSVAVLAVAGAALAQNAGVIETRKKLFKEIDVGADDMEDMVKGKRPFDLAYVRKALHVMTDDAAKLKPLFPDDSKVGKTRALPSVWEQKARFDGLLDAFGKDAAAAETAVKDEASFKAAMPKVFGDCKGCHDDFRARKR